MNGQVLWDRRGDEVRMSREAFRFLQEVIRRTSARVAACLRRCRMILGAGGLLLECAPEDFFLLNLMQDGLDGAVQAVFGGHCRLELAPVALVPARREPCAGRFSRTARRAG